MTDLDDLQIDVTDAEILADLSWPGPPPGDWRWTPRRASPAASSDSGSRPRLDRVAPEVTAIGPSLTP
jgi:hypothetical protein